MLSTPVIDAHHHFGVAGDGHGPDELRRELEAERISGSVLIATRPSAGATRAALETAASVPYVHGVVGWLDLAGGDIAAQIEALREGPGGQLLVGLRHDVHDEADAAWLVRADVRRGLAAVGAAGLAFDLGLSTAQLSVAMDTCLALPEVRFVLEHLARPPIASGDLSAWGRTLLELAELPNLSATISGLVTEADALTWSIDDLRHPVELAVDAFGPARLMLGSDWPRCLAAGTYSDVIDSVRYLLADLPAHQVAEVRGGTAVRIYQLMNAYHAT